MVEIKHFAGRYRKDIQILRGISVLLVVLFHLEIGGFKSGFLGVDVFFVISGYLMAVLYKPDRKLEFFKKRINRLLPAYFAVILATLVCGAFRTTPNEFNAVVNQSLFATFFASNVGFWLQNSYFSKAAFNPLLHLWSLGVEIQFYLLLPVLYWLFYRVRGSFFVILLGSLAACFFVVGISPKTSFFMVPFRLWEFQLGYGSAWLVARQSAKPGNLWPWLGLIGLMVLTAIPTFKIDGQAENILLGHPGILALGVCLATSVILLTGLPAVIENLRVATLLEKLGQYSYSIYLIHFPLIVLFLYKPFSGTILKTSIYWQTPVMAGIIVLLSALIYYLIEEPFRANAKTPKYLLIAAFSVFFLGPIGQWYQQISIPAREMDIYNAWTDRSTYRCGKMIRIFHPGAISCEITPNMPEPAHRVLLAGNSHADSIKTEFANAAQAKNIMVRFIVDNDPLMGSGLSPQALVDEAVATKSDTVVLHFSPGAVTAETVAKVQQLAEAKRIAVSYIMPVPVWKQHIPLALWENLKKNSPLPVANINDYRQRNQELSEGLQRISAPNFKMYDIAEVFCQQQCRILTNDGKPLYFDEGHLTLTGSRELMGVFAKILDDLGQPSTTAAK